MELGWLRKIDFFPPKRSTWGDLKEICIATKSRNLGDALMLTTLPEKLRAKYPGVRVRTYPRGFNRIVFRNNPAVSGTDYLPRAVYGDDINWGEGHLIEVKEAFFELPRSETPKPRIFLSEEEQGWARDTIRRHTLSDAPLCILHPWGTTRSQVASREFWSKLIERVKEAGPGKVRFWQVGLEGHAVIPGCEHAFLVNPKRREDARRLFAVMAQAQSFVGVDSGPMHVARAFELPSLVLTELFTEEELQSLFALRHEVPSFDRRVRPAVFLYEQNQHLSVKTLENDLSLELERGLEFFARL